MIIELKSVELFKNLSQFETDNIHYDFHNEFNCVKIIFEHDILVLFLKKVIDNEIVSIRFNNVILEKVDFFDFSNMKDLTIDNLYRGRFEIAGKLIEYNNEGKGYFYLDFYGGQKIEFWCRNLEIEKI